MPSNPITKKTSDELQVDCDVAAKVIAEYLAFWARELAKERDNEAPNLEKIETIETQLRELKREKLCISVDNIDAINKVLYVYAPLLKFVYQRTIERKAWSNSVNQED